MQRKLILAGAAATLASLAAAAPASAATTVQLALGQSTAFSILGYDCGGISQQAFASGFDPVSGAPDGYVYMWTICNGSGKGGHSIKIDAWASVNWGFDGSVASDTVATAAPTVDPTFSATDGHGDQLYNQSNEAYVSVVPAAAPTAVAASRSGGQFLVSWTPDPTAPPMLIGSSTITATPAGTSSPPITATVTGSASSGLLGPLEPNTTYSVTVTSNDAGGSSPPSQAITIVTTASRLAPGAPSGITAVWTSPGNTPDPLMIAWSPGAAGDSPTDQYRVRVFSFQNGYRTNTVSGATLTDSFGLDDGVTWYLQVRAHDVAGWGRWSAPVKVLPAAGG